MHDRVADLLLFYPVFLFCLSVHEAAHAFVANKLGDPTARYLGRITLNPLPHMDFIGTFLLPVFGILSGAPVIGWGKPVPVDPSHFHDPRRGNLWVAAAGPASNILLAFVFAGVSWGLLFLLPHLPPTLFQEGSFGASSLRSLFTICQMAVLLNFMLALFNLLPLFPLDGSSIVRGLLPESMLDGFDHFSRYGMLILLLFFASGLLRYLFIPVAIATSTLLP